MVLKTYSPAVIDALAECLRTVYWFKNELKSFLLRVGVDPRTVSALPWDGYKRHAIRALLDRLSTEPASGKPILDKLLDGIVEQDERFPHLAGLDDGERRVSDARRAVHHLKDLLGTVSVAERASQARLERRTEAERAAIEASARRADLGRLNDRFLALCVSEDSQRRGYDLQDLLRDLFALHDLDPRGSFARPGEQTDGSITLDGTVLLIEARWTRTLTDPREVREFRTKVHDKLDNTLGLMISMSGFTDEAISSAAGGGRMVVVLMDGQDLASVFAGLTDLVDLLHRKLRHAAETGNAMYRIGGTQ